MKAQFTLLSVLSAAAVAVAAPHVDQDEVVLSQDAATKMVSISYVLTGEPAVITVDIQTNLTSGGWVSIGAEKFTELGGEVNKLVTETDVRHVITWQPKRKNAWPNQEIKNGGLRAVVKAWAVGAPPPYMVIDLDGVPGKTWYYSCAEAIPHGVTNALYKTKRLVMKLVPAANVQWRMGSPSTQLGVVGNGYNYTTRETPHYVTLTNDYYMAVYPTTQAQHVLFGCSNPSTSVKTEDSGAYPVETLTWVGLRGWGGSGYPANWPDPACGHNVGENSFIDRARKVTGILTLDLPTEAQLEYASRAGVGDATYAGDLTATSQTGKDDLLEKIAWYCFNSGSHTHEVGTLEPNAWGFYDMVGNVRVWCLDVWAGTMGGSDAVEPLGPTTTDAYSYRTIRGSSFKTDTYRQRCGVRWGYYCHDTSQSEIGDIGYRLTCAAIAVK